MKKTLFLVILIIFNTSFVSAELRTIIIDGGFGDWEGVPPLVTDPMDDQTGVPEEDIKAVYACNDAEYLYFRMELYNDLPLVYLVQQSNFNSEFVYIFFIDSIPGTGDPDYGGADYAIEYSLTGLLNVVVNVTSYDELQQSNTYLVIWNETGGYWAPDFDCANVAGNHSGADIEVRVPWECIGGEDCFNAMFMARIGAPNTDYAPDMKQGVPVTVQYCPLMPVAGELLPGLETRLASYLITALMLSSLMIIAYSWGKPRKTFL